MTDRDTLVRICAACGLQKPISAFLQLGGKQGAHYGNICSSCRSKGITERPKESLDDELSDTQAKNRIGAKEKYEMDKEKKRQFDELVENHLEEVKKKEKLFTDKTEEELGQQKVERDRRENYLDYKSKQGPFDSEERKKTLTNEAIERGVRKDITQTRQTSIQNQQNLQNTQLTEGIKKEHAQTGLDFTNAYFAPQTSEARFYSDVFQKFCTWLGNDAPIKRTMEQAFGKRMQNPAITPPTNQARTDQNADKNLTNYIDETMKPSSGRKK